MTSASCLNLRSTNLKFYKFPKNRIEIRVNNARKSVKSSEEPQFYFMEFSWVSKGTYNTEEDWQFTKLMDFQLTA